MEPSHCVVFKEYFSVESNIRDVIQIPNED